MGDDMGEHQRAEDPTRRLRRATIVLEALTILGTLAGVQGFLAGSFAPLVDDLETKLPIDGPLVPAAALGLVVGGSQTAALILGIKNRPRAPQASLLAGTVLVVWVVAQLPLIG